MNTRRALPGALLASLLVVVAAPAHGKRGDEEAIRDVLRRQTEAWNRGDLAGYMAGYWRSPSLTFYGGGTVTRGWQETLDRYRKKYQAPGAEMGRLEMSEIEVTLLARDAALVSGRWRLEMASGKAPRGLFTLLVRKLPEGWRVVHDHSSSE